MNEQNIFEGIPGLDDQQGLANYLNQQSVEQNAGQPAQVPNLLIPNNQEEMNAQNQQGQQGQPDPNQGQTQGQGQGQSTINVGGVQYTAEQVQQIIAQNNAIIAQQRALASAQQSQTQNQTYTPQQAMVIKQLIDRGVPIEKIQQALRGDAQNNALNNRLNNIEQFLQQQAYAREEAEFINKMTTFGDKFGLSEGDLVTFANVAMSKGINMAQVNDVEAVFRALYPDQYAIRLQRMNQQPSGQMFGGSSIPEAPRANASKIEDAYVENFLKNAMPNQYMTRK